MQYQIIYMSYRIRSESEHPYVIFFLASVFLDHKKKCKKVLLLYFLCLRIYLRHALENTIYYLRYVTK